jgi:DNA-binding MarR family transcriptional regulator
VGKRAAARDHRAPAPAPASGLSAIKGSQSPKASLELDRLIHERVRLAIVSALAVNESLTFNELKHLLGTTDGNLSVHARRLEEADYVECLKSFEGRMPKTEFRLTRTGREALERYLSHMEGLIRSTRAGS